MPGQLAFYLENHKIRILFYTIHKVDFRGIKELNKIKEKFSNLRRKYMYDIQVGQGFINKTKQCTIIKENIGIFDYINIKRDLCNRRHNKPS